MGRSMPSTQLSVNLGGRNVQMQDVVVGKEICTLTAKVT